MSLPTYTASNPRRVDTYAPEFASYAVDVYADGVYVGVATMSPEFRECLLAETRSIDSWTDYLLRRHIESLEVRPEDCDELVLAVAEAIESRTA